MSLLVTLPSSSFFLQAHLSHKLSSSNYSKAEYNYALKLHNEAALTLQVANERQGSEQWIKAQQILAKTQASAAFSLALYYQKISKKLSRQISNNQLKDYFGQAHLSDRQTKMWLIQAIRLGESKAITLLVQFYYERDELEKAKNILEAYQQELLQQTDYINVLILRVKIALDEGQHRHAVRLIQQDLQQFTEHKVGKDFLALLESYQVLSTRYSSTLAMEKAANSENLLNVNCTTSLQLFANKMAHLTHLENMISAFNNLPLAEYICLPPPRYISKNQIQCSTSADEVIRCQESSWQSVAKSVDSRYIGLMREEGGANVHYGMLYFDKNDTLEVFTHEVSHLLGFVDEYPLVKNHDKCVKEQETIFSQNIVVLPVNYIGTREKVRAKVLARLPWASHIKDSTPILQQIANSQNQWRLSTPQNHADQVGVFNSKTCDNAIAHNDDAPEKRLIRKDKVDFGSFKPIALSTQLESFSHAFPTTYLEFLNDNPTEYLMPSFHYNLALSVYKQGDIAKAVYWLKHAASRENNARRKSIILQGAY